MEMNPFISIEFVRSIEECKSVSAIVASISCFKQAMQLNNQIKGLLSKPAFYGVNSSGLFGFAFIDFGEISYEYNKPGEEPETIQVTSKSLEDFMKGFFNCSKLDWNRREAIKPSKMLLSEVLVKAVADIESISLDEAQQKVKNQFLACKHDYFKAQETQFENFRAKFRNQFGLEFNVTSGVISSVLSQEIIKVLTKRDRPASGFMVYNGEDQSFTIQHFF